MDEKMENDVLIEETPTTDNQQPQEITPTAGGSKLKKLIAFIKANENLRQLVFFTLFSFVCFLIEFVSYTVLTFGLKKVNQPISWFVFNYSQNSGGLGAFIAFLVSNCLAQIATFVLNRKKTFKSTNNIAISGTMYAIVVCGIIILNTSISGPIIDACFNSIKSYSPLSSDAISTICGYISKLIGAAISFTISFLANKFLIMRNWGSKKTPATPDNTDPQEEPATEATISEE